MRRVRLAIELQRSPLHENAYRVALDTRAVSLLREAGWQIVGSVERHCDMRPRQALEGDILQCVVETVVPSCSEIYALALECHQVGIAMDGHLYGWPYHYQPGMDSKSDSNTQCPEEFHIGDALWSHTVALEGERSQETIRHENIMEVLEEGRESPNLPEDHQPHSRP